MSRNVERRATKSIAKGILGNYRKHNVMLVSSGEEPTTIDRDPHWSGGSKDEWTFWAIRGNNVVPIGSDEAGVETVRTREDGSPLVGLAGAFTRITLHDGIVARNCGYFCGKPATMYLHGKQKDLDRLNRE
jgi:hypothetical protein